MNKITLSPDLADRLTDACDKGILRQGAWGDGVERVSMMSALVPGATSALDCIRAGWPDWLAVLCTNLYNAYMDPDNNQAIADEWALRLAQTVAGKEIDYDVACARFGIGMLRLSLSLDALGVAQPVIDQVERGIADGDFEPTRTVLLRTDVATTVKFIEDQWADYCAKLPGASESDDKPDDDMPNNVLAARSIADASRYVIMCIPSGVMQEVGQALDLSDQYEQVPTTVSCANKRQFLVDCRNILVDTLGQ